MCEQLCGDFPHFANHALTEENLQIQGGDFDSGFPTSQNPGDFTINIFGIETVRESGSSEFPRSNHWLPGFWHVPG